MKSNLLFISIAAAACLTLFAFSIRKNDTAGKTLNLVQAASYRNAGASSLHHAIDQKSTSMFDDDSIPPDKSGMRDITAMELTKQMGFGWNLGNALDATGGDETAWGTPKATQRLIDSVKAAGFNAVRIPVSWSKFTDSDKYTIDTNWMARVETVVNYALKDNMYVVLNLHWDGGWIQPTYADQRYVTRRMAYTWLQIAVRFRNYNDHLLFAGTNEVHVKDSYGPPTVENYTVQNSFNQVFVSIVRSTGGRNAYRDLVVQGYNTNIDHTVNFFKMPKDRIPDRLVVEVHYYDPYEFTLANDNKVTEWGKYSKDPSKKDKWGDEFAVDDHFEKMKENFIDKGVPVIIGEYAPGNRLNLGSDSANAHYQFFKNYYLQYVTSSATAHGLVPFYWDSGSLHNYGSALFNRKTGARAYPQSIKAITGK